MRLQSLNQKRATDAWRGGTRSAVHAEGPVRQAIKPRARRSRAARAPLDEQRRAPPAGVERRACPSLAIVAPLPPTKNRTLALPGKVKHLSLTSLREKVVKIGAKIVRHGRYTIFQMTEVERHASYLAASPWMPRPSPAFSGSSRAMAWLRTVLPSSWKPSASALARSGTETRCLGGDKGAIQAQRRICPVQLGNTH